LNCEAIIDVERGFKYLDSLRNYEGGFSMIESGESNGKLVNLAGLTYCAVASYLLFDKEIKDKKYLIHWLCNRSNEIGINGRTGKIPDSCYTFWVFASLYNIGKDDVFNKELAIEFVLNCQTAYVN
jgi:prenyltransferase beta subunit